LVRNVRDYFSPLERRTKLELLTDLQVPSERVTDPTSCRHRSVPAFLAQHGDHALERGGGFSCQMFQPENARPDFQIRRRLTHLFGARHRAVPNVGRSTTLPCVCASSS